MNYTREQLEEFARRTGRCQPRYHVRIYELGFDRTFKGADWNAIIAAGLKDELMAEIRQVHPNAFAYYNSTNWCVFELYLLPPHRSDSIGRGDTELEAIVVAHEAVYKPKEEPDLEDGLLESLTHVRDELNRIIAKKESQ